MKENVDQLALNSSSSLQSTLYFRWSSSTIYMHRHEYIYAELFTYNTGWRILTPKWPYFVEDSSGYITNRNGSPLLSFVIPLSFLFVPLALFSCCVLGHGPSLFPSFWNSRLHNYHISPLFFVALSRAAIYFDVPILQRPGGASQTKYSPSTYIARKLHIDSVAGARHWVLVFFLRTNQYLWNRSSCDLFF